MQTRNVKARDLEAALQRAGGVRVRTGHGGHRKYRLPKTNHLVVFSYKDPVSPMEITKARKAIERENHAVDSDIHGKVV
jgi:predicted RNA binding protein YcfA (HicA-like mRNA interferase family)